jgi:threonine/homoserine/homoserine lactone efflux protein
MELLTVILPYLVALVTVYLTPGPDMVLVVAVSSSQGLGRGLRVALGFALARFLHVFGSGLGLATILNLYPGVRTGMQIVGVGYLVFLSWGMMRSAGESSMSAPVQKGAFFHGFVTNILNPKALLFCSLLLPQFVYSHTLPLYWQFFVLGLVLVGVGLFFDFFYAVVAARVGRVFFRGTYPWVHRILAPGVLLVLASYLVLTLG